MGFWLKKVIGYWLMPLPLSLALIVFGGFLLRFTRRRGLGRGLMAVGVLWLGVCSNAGIATWLVWSLEARYPSQPPLLEQAAIPPALARCDYIAVLGGGHATVPNWPANHQLSASALARIVEGVRLARVLPRARLIVSGPQNINGGPAHARVLADAAVSLGVDRSRIVEIDTARDTEEEAAAIANITNGAPLALVTSAWHLPRATALCRKRAIDVLPCPADFSAQTDRLEPAELLRWNQGALERSTKAIYERIGATWSKLRGKT